jgi:hypothetical protein
MGQLPDRQQKQQAGRKGAQHGDCQRIILWQQLRRDQIGAAPDCRRDRGDQQIGMSRHDAPSHLS